MKCPICGNETKTYKYDWMEGIGYANVVEQCGRCKYHEEFAYGTFRFIYPLLQKDNEVILMPKSDDEKLALKQIKKLDKKYRKLLLRQGKIKNCIRHTRRY